MTSPDDRIAELEKKVATLEGDLLEHVRYLTRCTSKLQHEVNRLSSVHPDLQTLEKLVFDAYTESNEKAQDALFEVDDIVPLDAPSSFFSQLPTIREARRKS